jgi:hypothetical protein
MTPPTILRCRAIGYTERRGRKWGGDDSRAGPLALLVEGMHMIRIIFCMTLEGLH